MAGTAAAEPGTRRRDAEASRAAILRAARVLFARHAYSDITLKAVAEQAGVSAPLIVKYFGSKERLFSRVLSFEDDAEALLDAPLEELGRHMVTLLLTSQFQGRGRSPCASSSPRSTAATATPCAPTSRARSSPASPTASPARTPRCAPNSPSACCWVSA